MTAIPLSPTTSSLVDGFSSRRILVLGDLIADEFIYGEVSRVSREAPVLILKYDTTEIVAGPHTGVWPDGYYMSAHVFNAAGTTYLAGRVYVFERDAMIAGQPARMLKADLAKDGTGIQYGFLPADLDSLTPPPAGEAAFVLGPNAQFTNRTDSTRVKVAWGTTPTITLTSAVISTSGISAPPCVNNTAAQNNRDCVPQPSPAVGADDLDNLGSHFMYRLAYRNNGTQAAPQPPPARSARR